MGIRRDPCVYNLARGLVTFRHKKKKKKQPSLLKDRVQARSSRFTLYMWRNHPQLLCPSLVIPRGRNKRRNERLSFLTRHVLQKASISHLFRSQRAQEELRSVPSLRPRLSRNLSSVILWCNFRAGFCATKRFFFFFSLDTLSSKARSLLDIRCPVHLQPRLLFFVRKRILGITCSLKLFTCRYPF